MALQVGDNRFIRLEEVRNVAGELADPTTVSVTVRKPDDTEETLTLEGGKVEKEKTGYFRALVHLDQAGTWAYSWSTTGDPELVEPGFMYVASVSLEGPFPLCSAEDVARVLQVDVDTLPDTSTAIEVASEWVRRFMREPNLGSGTAVTRSYWNVRADGWLATEGTPTKVSVRRSPGGTLEELIEGTEWDYEDGQGVRLRTFIPIEAEEDPRYGPGGFTRVHTEVQVEQSVPSSVNLLVTEAAANIVASMLTQGPRQARGILSETIGDYSYNRGLWRLASGPNEASPFFATAKGYLRPLGGGGLPFVP